MYEVHWKECHKRDSTWEPEPNLVNCSAAAMVQKYRSIHVPKVFRVTNLDPDYLATHEIVQRHKLNLPFDKCLTAYKLDFKANDDYNLFKEKLMARIPKMSTPLGNIPLAHDG